MEHWSIFVTSPTQSPAINPGGGGMIAGPLRAALRACSLALPSPASWLPLRAGRLFYLNALQSYTEGMQLLRISLLQPVKNGKPAYLCYTLIRPLHRQTRRPASLALTLGPARPRHLPSGGEQRACGGSETRAGGRYVGTQVTVPANRWQVN